MYIYIDIDIDIDIEDLTLNSLHTTVVFRAEDKGVSCPPLSSGMTEVCSVAVSVLHCCFSFLGLWKFCSKCFFVWRHDEKISFLLLRLGFVFRIKYFFALHRLHLSVTTEYGCTLSIISHDKWYSVFDSLFSILICSKLCLFFSMWLSLKLALRWLNLVLNSFSVISMYVSFCFLAVLFDSFLAYHSLMEALVLERAGFSSLQLLVFFICVDSRTGLLWLEIMFHIKHAAMA